jgi:hypothetical protein
VSKLIKVPASSPHVNGTSPFNKVVTHELIIGNTSQMVLDGWGRMQLSLAGGEVNK